MERWLKKSLFLFPRIFGLLFTVVVLVFSILSGAKGSGFKDVLLNIPNAFPWIILLGLFVVSFELRKIGAYLLIVYALLLGFFFKVYNNWQVFFIFILPIIFLAVMILISNWVIKKKR